MAVNLAAKYSSNVDEVIRKGTLTDSGVNRDYDFVGAKTVRVYSMSTAKMNDYKPTGTNRYGIPEELEDTTQELVMTRQRAFTFTIDKTNAIDSPEGVRDAGKALRRQLDEVVIPEIDTYRFEKMAENAHTVSIAEITSSNAYQILVDCNAEISENEIPSEGRIAYVSPKFFAELKKDDSFVKKSDMSQEIAIKGLVGQVDGLYIIEATSNRLPYGVSFIITHPMATTAPSKLEEYKIHENPPGIAGYLVEGLVYYDAFVLKNKRVCTAVAYGRLGKLDITAKETSSGKAVIAINGIKGGNFVYKTGASQSAVALGADVSSWTPVKSGDEIDITSGHKIVVAVSVNGKAVASSAPVTVS